MRQNLIVYTDYSFGRSIWQFKFFKYIYAPHDIAYIKLVSIQKNLFKEQFGIDFVNVEFFMLHELQGNKNPADNGERDKLIFNNFESNYS